MPLFLKYVLKEWTGGCQDDFMRLYLLTILTCQGHISKFLVTPETPKSNVDVFFEVIPLHYALSP